MRDLGALYVRQCMKGGETFTAKDNKSQGEICSRDGTMTIIAGMIQQSREVAD